MVRRPFQFVLTGTFMACSYMEPILCISIVSGAVALHCASFLHDYWDPIHMLSNEKLTIHQVIDLIFRIKHSYSLSSCLVGLEFSVFDQLLCLSLSEILHCSKSNCEVLIRFCKLHSISEIHISEYGIFRLQPENSGFLGSLRYLPQ